MLSAVGKQIELYGGIDTGAPLVVYHAVHDEGDNLWAALSKTISRPVSLAVINDIDWNNEMSPWAIPPISAKDTPCSGGADGYLVKLTEEIMPAILDALTFKPANLILAGYSLAGLLALYAAYRTDMFTQIVSASGSLWYPGLIDYVKDHSMSKHVRAVYLSLGDKESHTRNKYLAAVEENTIEIEEYLISQGMHTTYERNPGNHDQDAELRVAKGVKRTLEYYDEIM